MVVVVVVVVGKLIGRVAKTFKGTASDNDQPEQPPTNAG